MKDGLVKKNKQKQKQLGSFFMGDCFFALFTALEQSHVNQGTINRRTVPIGSYYGACRGYRLGCDVLIVVWRVRRWFEGGRRWFVQRKLKIKNQWDSDCYQWYTKGYQFAQNTSISLSSSQGMSSGHITRFDQKSMIKHNMLDIVEQNVIKTDPHSRSTPAISFTTPLQVPTECEYQPRGLGSWEIWGKWTIISSKLHNTHGVPVHYADHIVLWDISHVAPQPKIRHVVGSAKKGEKFFSWKSTQYEIVVLWFKMINWSAMSLYRCCYLCDW